MEPHNVSSSSSGSSTSNDRKKLVRQQSGNIERKEIEIFEFYLILFILAGIYSTRAGATSPVNRDSSRKQPGSCENEKEKMLFLY